LPPTYTQICREILALNPHTRFAGVVSLEARILAAEYREGLVPLLTPNESELSIMQSLMRMSIRKTLEMKMGKTLYATAVYQKVKRATVPLYNEGTKPDSILVVSFDMETNLEFAVLTEIMPYLRVIGKDLS
jgi:hypothetical protein